MTTIPNLAELDPEHLIPLDAVAAHLGVTEKSLHHQPSFKPLIRRVGQGEFRVKAGDLRAWIDGER